MYCHFLIYCISHITLSAVAPLSLKCDYVVYLFLWDFKAAVINNFYTDDILTDQMAMNNMNDVVTNLLRIITQLQFTLAL